jgi:hypothetical protein
MPDEKEGIVTYQKQGLEVLGSKEEMVSRMDDHAEKINLAHDYIKRNFVKGVDYGPADPRNPKPVLLKPGAEKVCQLFNTRPTWRRDLDTWEMLGKPEGTVCFICEIRDNTTGEIVGEGRGAEKVGNKQRDANKVIKIAEKCALVDAALFTFGLSEMFTQDMTPAKNDTEAAKAELVNDVDLARQGCESTLTTVAFLHEVSKDFLHENGPRSVGAVEALRKVVLEQGKYDLATGQRIPE